MNTLNRNFFLLVALIALATGGYATSVTADMEDVPVLATRSRLVDDTDVFKLDVSRQQLTIEISEHVNEALSERLADEFDAARRSALLASDVTEQILDALNERLPEEGNDTISAVN